MSQRSAQKPNRLAGEKSPYLLQHARNPVDWYPWGEEAFARAEAEDKPVFLSCGYSTCHWCHVMAAESFEDPAVAACLNDHFVPVKVDREERPDVDMLYMTACQLVSGQGGWPLSVFMTPGKAPFYAGTYFPPQSRRGLPGFLDILHLVSRQWHERREELTKAGQEVLRAVESHFRPAAPREMDPGLAGQALEDFAGRFDPVWGGFGSAPKFPGAHNLLFLLRYHRRTEDPRALAMVEKTLSAMYRGGIHDHIGGGFARYSTDERWLVPHFEKMLYDQALLAMAYLEAAAVTGNPSYGTVARRIFTYVQREMTGPEGAFFTALDADSEGGEGMFYLWTPDEVTAVLGEEDGAFFCRTFDITPAGNFAGRSIPNLIQSGAGLFGDGDETRMESCRTKMWAARQKRVGPAKDDKVLTGCNGLMIAAMAAGTRVLGDEAYARWAARAAGFVLDRLQLGGRLLARYREGQAAVPAFIDDYAFFTWGLLELHQVTGDGVYRREAAALTRQMQNLFGDPAGGFFFTGWDAQDLPVRPRQTYDGAVPSGGAVAVMNLVRLGRLTKDPAFTEGARRGLTALMGEAARQPAAHTFFLCALDEETHPHRKEKGEGNHAAGCARGRHSGPVFGGHEDRGTVCGVRKP